jgi:hypothetical protein
MKVLELTTAGDVSCGGAEQLQAEVDALRQGGDARLHETILQVSYKREHLESFPGSSTS